MGNRDFTQQTSALQVGASTDRGICGIRNIVSFEFGSGLNFEAAFKRAQCRFPTASFSSHRYLGHARAAVRPHPEESEKNASLRGHDWRLEPAFGRNSNVQIQDPRRSGSNTASCAMNRLNSCFAPIRIGKPWPKQSRSNRSARILRTESWV